MAKKPLTPQQRFAILQDKKKIIKKICENEITSKSGIYLFYRINEKGEKCFYVGQAKDLLTRCGQHLMGREQHIDKSLYVHKFYSADNPTGWRLRVIKTCDRSQLDLAERTYIQYYLDKNYKSYNVAGGGQFNKAEDVGERYEVKLKTYKNGKMFAYEKARLYVKNMFDKYLDYTIKGKPTKIKERKFAEFGEFLAEADKENSDSN